MSRSRSEFLKFQDLDEAVEWLSHNPVFDKVRAFDEGEEAFLARTYGTLGRWIRNHFGLWRDGFESPLVKWFWETLHLSHAADMGGVILTALYRRAQGQQVSKFDLLQMAERYHEHWYKTMVREGDDGSGDSAVS